MNAQQRRKLRRSMERLADQVRFTPAGSKVSERPMAWPMVLLVRASRSHADSMLKRRSTHGSRSDRHLFKVLDDRRFAVHGIRYAPASKPPLGVNLPLSATGSIDGVAVSRCPTCSVWLVPGQSCGHEASTAAGSPT